MGVAGSLIVVVMSARVNQVANDGGPPVLGTLATQ